MCFRGELTDTTARIYSMAAATAFSATWLLLYVGKQISSVAVLADGFAHPEKIIIYIWREQKMGWNNFTWYCHNWSCALGTSVRCSFNHCNLRNWYYASGTILCTFNHWNETIIDDTIF